MRISRQENIFINLIDNDEQYEKVLYAHRISVLGISIVAVYFTAVGKSAACLIF
jgi:hypothetical protein